MVSERTVSNEGPRLFTRGDNNEIAKTHWRMLKIFFSRTIGTISTKLCTKHPFMRFQEFQVCSSEGPRPILKEDSEEIAKINWNINSFLESLCRFQTHLTQSIHGWRANEGLRCRNNKVWANSWYQRFISRDVFYYAIPDMTRGFSLLGMIRRNACLMPS